MEKRLPVCAEFFDRLTRTDYGSCLFVDQTEIIREVLSSDAKVKLIPAPRRFGKSLNLDMFRNFLSIEGDPSLFDGLKITQDPSFCAAHLGKHPVLYLYLFGVKGLSFEECCCSFADSLNCHRDKSMSILSRSEALSGEERTLTDSCWYLSREDDLPARIARISAWAADIARLQRKHYGRKTVVLIDEYDAPLSYAWGKPYFEDMVSLTRGVYSRLLESDDVEFAVLTGVMRTAWETLFPNGSGPSVWTPSADFPAGLFCFRREEALEILEPCGLVEDLSLAEEWYGAFRYRGESRICPWDILRYADEHREGRSSRHPSAIRLHATGDRVLTAVLERTAWDMREDYRELLRGGAVWKPVRPDLSYADLEDGSSVWYLWVASGYLTIRSRPDPSPDAPCELILPNREAKVILKDKLKDLLPRKDKAPHKLYWSLCDGEPWQARSCLSVILEDLSSRMRASPDTWQDAMFYAGVLLGILAGECQGPVPSLRPAEGICVLCFQSSWWKHSTGVVLGIWSGPPDEFSGAAEAALAQIRSHEVIRELREGGCSEIRLYGIAVRKTDCQIRAEKVPRSGS